MPTPPTLNDFAPPFTADQYSRAQQYKLAPFFTNLEQSVYVPLIFSPEVIGALCSRTSRAADDLRLTFLNEYIEPFIAKDSEYGEELQAFIDFLHDHPIEKIFSNPKARSFYNKWLAQYGDDSIAQMAGMHIVFSSLSMLGIKHLEDQRIGLAPIEKSTRYVDYSTKINGKFRYYTDPTLKALGLKKDFEAAMNNLFDTWLALRPRLQKWLLAKFPAESPLVVEKKAFDTLRGLLPVATLSQVAFFGNGQAFEYLVSRSLGHRLGEIRWAAERVYEELAKITPSFLRRVKDETHQAATTAYQQYLARRGERMKPYLKAVSRQKNSKAADGPTVALVEYDPAGEAKVIAGMLYAAEDNQASWDATLAAVRNMNNKTKEAALNSYLAGRTQRWQKVGRAFENAYVRYEITMNIGSWTDLHRHRMLTQQRQMFTTAHGYDVPPEIVAAGLGKEYRSAVAGAEKVFDKIAAQDSHVAQYAVTRAHRIRFQQWTNLRSCFWEMELRTIPEGHPDYRYIEQEKFKLLAKVYPTIAKFMRVNMGQYDFARRGQEEKIQQKLKELAKVKA